MKNIKKIFYILFFFLLSENGYSLSVSSDNLSLAFDEQGSITQVFLCGQTLPRTSTFGGLMLRELTGANKPVGAEEFYESFEDTITNWTIYPGSQSIDFSLTTNEFVEGNKSLLCKVAETNSSQIAQIVSPLIHISAGKKYRIQCEYKATRGYLSYENSNHAARWLYDEYNRSAGNSLGYYICESNGNLRTGHLVIAPFVAQAREWKAVGGEIIAGESDEYMRVTISANLNPKYDTEGFYVDKIEVFEMPAVTKNILGSAWEISNGLAFTGTIDNFIVEAEWVGLSNSINVFGQVRRDVNLVSNDSCAFDLIVSLPVDASDWLWLYDAAKNEEIKEKKIYKHSVSADYQSDLPVSLYPYAGISSGEFTIAVGVPLTPPNLCEMKYDAARELLEADFHFGISEKLNHTSANFELKLGALKKGQGFRGIIHWYREEYFESNTWFETEFISTNYLSWDRRDYSGANAKLCASHDTQQIMSVEYTVPDLVIQDAGMSNDIPPTLSGLLGIVNTNKFTGTLEQQYYFTNVAPQIKRASNGDPVLKYLAVKDYTGGRIQGVFKINASPLGKEKGYHTYITNYVCGPAFRDTIAITAVLDAVQLDNFLSKTTINCATNAIAFSSFNLTYSPNDYTVGTSPAAELIEYLSWLRRWIDANTVPPYRAILINWWGLATPNACLPWIDICAGEVRDAISDGKYGSGYESNFDPEILRYKRALAYHKPLGMAFEGDNISSNDVLDTLHNCLLYAMGGQFKIGVGLVDMSYLECVAIAREFTAIASKLNEAGWEPIVMASCDNGQIYLERYGEKGGEEIFIVAQNSGTNSASGNIILEPELGVSNDWEAVEYISGEQVEIKYESGDYQISFSNLPARRVNVYMLSAAIPEPVNFNLIILIIILKGIGGQAFTLFTHKSKKQV